MKNQGSEHSGDLTAAVEHRLSDPLWEIRMAKSVVRGESGRKVAYRGAVAAFALSVLTGGFYAYITGFAPFGSGDSGGSIEISATDQVVGIQPVDMDQFPFDEEVEVTMISAEELYGE